MMVEQLKVRSIRYSVLAQNQLSVLQEWISLQICVPILETVVLGTFFKICFIGFLLFTRTDEWNYEVLVLQVKPC